MNRRLIFIIEILFLVIIFFLANIRSFVFWSLFPETNGIFKEAWREVVIWLIALSMMLYLLYKNFLISDYLSAWLKEPLLIGFILFSLVSILWSENWTATLHRSLIFTFATLTAVFLGLRYLIRGLLQTLSWVGAIIVIASLLMVLLNPEVGKYSIASFYKGAWRGIFWNRNQLGNILSLFNLIFLLYFFLLKYKNAPVKKLFALVFYILSLAEIFYAKSASGYILTLLLHFVLGAAFLWLYVRDRLSPSHYYVILFFLAFAVIGIILNLDFVLGLFNRTPTFTGRVPMWAILLRDVFPQNPWLGVGFGTIWSNVNFRLKMRDLTGWGFPLVIGDNGFLDLLLNLGVIGLLLFLLNYVKAWVGAGWFFLRKLSLEGSFPFIFMVFTLFANLTFSLFMETEVFIWMIIVALMVISTRKKNDNFKVV